MHDDLDICVFFDTTPTSWGGGNQFLRSLAQELSSKGHQITRRPTSSTEIVLFNAFLYAQGKHLRPRHVARLSRTGARTGLRSLMPQRMQMLFPAVPPPVLIHRVDGVPELVRGHRTIADDVQLAVNRLTDHTVFQSEFCKSAFATHCGVSPASSRVILNGVDPTVFFADQANTWETGPMRLAAVSWSSNPRKGFQTLADVSRLPGLEVTFAGNWCPDVDPAYVRLAGVLNSAEVAGVMRSSHAMIHAAWNEPSSNAIMEALACGLPVIYRDSGGNRELAGDYGIPLEEDLSKTIGNFRRRYTKLRRKVLTDRGRFAIGRAAEEYLSFFRYAIENRHTAQPRTFKHDRSGRVPGGEGGRNV